MAENEKITPMEQVANADLRKHSFKRTITVEGYHKTGTFVARLPSVMDRVTIGVRRAQMLGAAPATTVNNGASSISAVDPFTDDLAFMIAFLDVLLVKRPKWFVWEALDEVQDVREMFTEVSQWANSFHRKPEAPAAEHGTTGQPTADAEDMAGDEDI
ncbi:MAG: hypothetical protein NC548_20030 [Lachnospiraceae bacterium]|nr:hypothetical protein [Lachnospiraceae bacterium]